MTKHIMKAKSSEVVNFEFLGNDAKNLLLLITHTSIHDQQVIN